MLGIRAENRRRQEGDARSIAHRVAMLQWGITYGDALRFIRGKVNAEQKGYSPERLAAMVVNLVRLETGECDVRA